MLKKFSLLFSLLLLLVLNPVCFAEIPEPTINLAKKYSFEPEKFHSLLKQKCDYNHHTIELVPMTENDRNFYINLFYNPNKSILRHTVWEDSFKFLLSKMWNKKIPTRLTFILKYDNRSAGVIFIGPLNLKKHFIRPLPFIEPLDLIKERNERFKVARYVDKTCTIHKYGYSNDWAHNCSRIIRILLMRLMGRGFYELNHTRIMEESSKMPIQILK